MRSHGLLALFLGVGVMLGQAMAAEPLDLNVLSFNIRCSSANDGPNHWQHRKEQVAALVHRLACDFVGMQEVCPDQLADLKPQLTEYQFLARSRRADPTVDEAVPLLFRTERWKLDAEEQGTFWLSATPEEPGSATFGNHLPRIATWGRFTEKASGRSVYVFNTHFDHQSETARTEAAKLLAQRIADRRHPDPVVMLGDLNCQERGETATPIQLLTGKIPGAAVTLLDTFRVFYPEKMEEIGTFHSFTGKRNGEKIDYVLALSPVEVRAAEILYDHQDGRYVSDHFPLQAKLRFPATGP